MDTDKLIEEGNGNRAARRYGAALQCYALAFAQDHNSMAAFNNYGNVLREMGQPARAVPFLQYAIAMDPNNATAQFNLAVAYLLMGDYARGWPQYESRWNYEHLAGTLPQFSQPRWTGQDVNGKTVLIVGEQGHGDNIQFCRFIWNLHQAGAKIKLQVTRGLIPLLGTSEIIEQVGTYDDDMGDFDYWCPIMSLANVMHVQLETLPKPVTYINADKAMVETWRQTLGPKTRLRVGLAWSGRRDSWLNQHKGIPFEKILALVERNPQYEWINLQIDSTPEEEQSLDQRGVRLFPGAITGFHDTAALMTNLDVVLSVDTAVGHLGGAIGRPTWIMLPKFALDWRWLLDRDDSPWYSTVRLFRQPDFEDWDSVLIKVHHYLSWFKV